MTPIDNDPNAGLGGSYEIINGQRVLISRTEDAHVQLHAFRDKTHEKTSSEGGPGPGAELNAAPVGVVLAPLEVAGEAAATAEAPAAGKAAAKK